MTKPDFFLDSERTYRSTLQFMAFEPGHNTMPELEVKTIDGTYRLHWSFAQGRSVEPKTRTVEVISNEFRMTLVK